MTTTTILITAAVTPSIPGVAIADPNVRKNQYIRAINYYVEALGPDGASFTIVETTGFPKRGLLSEVQDDSRIDWFSWEPDNATIQRGKGAIEAAAMDAVVESQEWADSRRIVKVTGRLIVSNIDRLLAEPFDDHHTLVRRSLDRSYVDTRLMVLSAGSFRRVFHGMSFEVDELEGRYLEHVVAFRTVVGEYSRSIDVKRFPFRPQFRGVSGTTGEKYGTGLDRTRDRLVGRFEGAVARLSRKQV